MIVISKKVLVSNRATISEDNHINKEPNIDSLHGVGAASDSVLKDIVVPNGSSQPDYKDFKTTVVRSATDKLDGHKVLDNSTKEVWFISGNDLFKSHEQAG